MFSLLSCGDFCKNAKNSLSWLNLISVNRNVWILRLLYFPLK